MRLPIMMMPPMLCAGKQLPAQPKRQQQTGGKPFTGVIAERHATDSGAEYLRLTFGQPTTGAGEVDDPSRVIDAEFLFPAGASRPFRLQ